MNHNHLQNFVPLQNEETEAFFEKKIYQIFAWFTLQGIAYKNFIRYANSYTSSNSKRFWCQGRKQHEFFVDFITVPHCQMIVIFFKFRSFDLLKYLLTISLGLQVFSYNSSHMRLQCIFKSFISSINYLYKIYFNNRRNRKLRFWTTRWRHMRNLRQTLAKLLKEVKFFIYDGYYNFTYVKQ